MRKPNFRVYYHPYARMDETECVESYAYCERDARWFARAFGVPFKVEVL